MTLPDATNPKIERLRQAVVVALDVLPRFDGTPLTELVDAATEIVVEYDEQVAYVQFLMNQPPPDPAEVQRLMVVDAGQPVRMRASANMTPRVSMGMDVRTGKLIITTESGQREELNYNASAADIRAAMERLDGTTLEILPHNDDAAPT